MEKYIHAFWHVTDNSVAKLARIADYFGDFRQAWESAEQKQLLACGLPPIYVDQVLALRTSLDLARAMDKLWQADITAIGRKNPEYPKELLAIETPPFLLYRKGTKLIDLPRGVGVVGTRKSTAWGDKLAFRLGKSLSEAGMTVVSGLAFGIDAAAHAGTLQASGKTIGILASGIGHITPMTHHSLAMQILAHGGAIISEYPLTSPAFKHRFLERNRLIAGLAQGVVIVEAAKRSGALITAGHAASQRKMVLAFPGDPGKPTSAGCNAVIKAGATLVDSISEVVQIMTDVMVANGLSTTLHTEEGTTGEGTPLEAAPSGMAIPDQVILTLLKRRHLSNEDLLQQSGLSWGQLSAIVGQLEITGRIKKDALFKWCLAS